MTEDYKIVIRCDHVTRAAPGAAKVVTPRIAVAHYRLSTDGTDPETGDAITVPAYGQWTYSPSHGGRITDPPTRDLPAPERALRRATQMQSPRSTYRPEGPDEPRIAIECLTCHQRVVALKENLDSALNNVRHADIHTLTLSQLRANL